MTLLLLGPLLAQEQRISPITTAEEFARASRETKRHTLNMLASSRLERTSAREVVDLIAAGLADADVDVRHTAVNAVAGRAAAVRFGDEQQKARALLERPELARLEPALSSLLVEDPNPRIRQSVVVALANLQFVDPGKVQTAELTRDFLETLVVQLETERDSTVRTEIMKTVALTSGDVTLRERALAHGLGSLDEGVLAFAVLGAARSKSVVGLPRIAVLLRHDSRNVRLQAAQALAAYGGAAAKYLPELRAAIEDEQDDVVRQTMQGSLKVLQGQ